MNKTTFSQDWQKYLEGLLNRSIIRFLDLEFRSQGIKTPTIQDLKEIKFERLEMSWLSVKSCKEFLLFQQLLKNAK